MGFHVGLCLSFDLGSKAIVRRILLYYTTSKIVSFKTKVPWFVIFRFLPLVQIVSHNTEDGVIPCNMPNWFWKRVFYTDHLRVQSINSPALTLICAKPFYTSTMENYCYEVCLGQNADFWSVMRELFPRWVNRDFQKVAKGRAFLNTTFKVRKRVIFPPFDACRCARHKIDLDVVNTNTISPYESITL